MLSSSLCSFFDTRADSSVLGPVIPLSSQFSHSLSLLAYLKARVQVPQHTKQQAKLRFCIFCLPSNNHS
jgi:hypothetical protein